MSIKKSFESFMDFKDKNNSSLFFWIIFILVIFFIVFFFVQFYGNKKYIKLLEEKFTTINEKFTNWKSDSFQQTVTAVDPIQRNLERIRGKVDDLEKRGINEENSLKNLMSMQKDLQQATDNIQKEAFRFITLFTKPNTRGGWSEEQLKTIVESVGMLPYCDFITQANMGSKRPDLVIKLPNEGLLFIDSKAPLDSYLNAPANLTEEQFDSLRKNNLKSIKTHIYTLSNKKYWSNEISPEMVVMFLPMERIWLDALEEDPKLIEYASSKNIIIATPMSLIALLKTIFYGWNQLYIAKDADKIKEKMVCLSNQTQEICDKLNSFMKVSIESQSKLQVYLNKFQELNSKIKDLYLPKDKEEEKI